MSSSGGGISVTVGRVSATVAALAAVAAGVFVVPGVTGGGGGGATTANVWADANGGTCTYSATPVEYSDAAACSSTNLDTGWDKLSSGDTMRVQAGTITSAQKITGGKAGDTFIIGAGQGQTVISDATVPDCEPQFGAATQWCSEAAHMVLQDVTIDANAEDGMSAGSWITGTGTNVTYRDVDIVGEHPDLLVEGSGFTWDGGTWADPGPFERVCGGSYGEIIWIQNSADNTLINGVTFNPQTTDVSCAPDNPHVEYSRWESGSNNITFSNNIYKPGADAGSGYHFASVSGTTGIRLIGNYYADNAGTTWAQIPNSTVDLVAYNTFSGDDSFAGTVTKWVGNLGPQQGVCSGTHVKNVWSGTGTCGSDTFVGATSLGVNSTTGALSAGSPAINAAESPRGDCPLTDRDGDARPTGGANCDAGADEYTGG